MILFTVPGLSRLRYSPPAPPSDTGAFSRRFSSPDTGTHDRCLPAGPDSTLDLLAVAADGTRSLYASM
jgi:hypothetical protein